VHPTSWEGWEESILVVVGRMEGNGGVSTCEFRQVAYRSFRQAEHDWIDEKVKSRSFCLKGGCFLLNNALSNSSEYCVLHQLKCCYKLYLTQFKKNNKIAQYHKMLIGHQKILNAP